MNIFSTLGKALTGGLEAIGQGIASEQMGPDWRKKAEMLGRLNEIELQVRAQQPEIQRMQAESMAYNRRALEEAARERARQDKIGRITGLFLGGKAPDPALLQGLDPADIASAQGAAEFERFKAQPKVPQQKLRKIGPGAESEFYNLPPGEYPEEYVNDIAQRKNAEAGRAVAGERWGSMPVKVGGIDPDTGNPAEEYVDRRDVTGTKRLKPAPAAAVESLSKFDQADEALRMIEQDMARYQNYSPITDPLDKTMAGYELDRKKQALAVQLGRALGEVGVFTDQDRATYAQLMGPGLILTEIAPEKTRDWFERTQAFLNQMREKRKAHFRRSFGYLPGEASSGPSVDYEANRQRLGGAPASDIDEIEALLRNR